MKFRKYYWYLSTFWKKHGLVLVGTIVIAVLIFSLFTPVIARIFEQKPTTYIGLVGNYTLTSLPEEIQKKVSMGLTSINDDGSVSPALSSRWSIEDEGQTYRFVIKENTFWQDGEPLDSNNINYQLDNVEKITTPNDIVFKLPDKYVPFPTIVAEPLFRFSKQPYLIFFKKTQVIGLGEYQITDYINSAGKLKEITIENNLERLVYRFYQAEDAAIVAFKQGEVDLLKELSSIPDISEWDTTDTYQEIHPEKYLAVFFNLDNPIFGKNIRQALSYALEKNPDENIRATGPINPLSWAYLEGGKTYDYDLDRAIERLLDDVPLQPLNFELITPTIYEDKAEEIKKQWEEFGTQAYYECQNSGKVEDTVLCEHVKINVQIRISNFPDTSNFQAMLIGQQSPADPDQYPLWHSQQSTNFSHYKNTRIDSLLEKGRQVVDVQERKAIYQEFQQFLLEDAPAIFLEHIITYEVERK